MADVILAYKREGDTCVGFIECKNGNLQPAVLVEGLPFHKMIALLSRVLKERTEDRCVFRRLEREDLKDFVLDEQFTDLIRKDPLTAVKMMSFDVAPVDLKKIEPKTVLTVAHDALADVFGDLVYLRRGGDELECPLCGDWTQGASDGEFQFSCAVTGVTHNFKLEDVSDQWAGVRVVDLLKINCVEFFLPRGWNKHGNWISHGNLEKMYQEFLKESEDVRSSKG